MGSWGFESCSSDGCWDLLEAEDIHEMTQDEVKTSIENSSEYLNGKSSDDRADGLGVVIWCLDHGGTIDVEVLGNAKRSASQLLEDKLYLERWSSIEDRVECLKKEVEILETAIKNDGVGTHRDVKGLIEKMFDRITEHE